MDFLFWWRFSFFSKTAHIKVVTSCQLTAHFIPCSFPAQLARPSAGQLRDVCTRLASLSERLSTYQLSPSTEPRSDQSDQTTYGISFNNKCFPAYSEALSKKVWDVAGFHVAPVVGIIDDCPFHLISNLIEAISSFQYTYLVWVSWMKRT